ncbi:MAG: hypothetical protein NVSMB55_09040 [Mycobacteriales bacterium]
MNASAGQTDPAARSGRGRRRWLSAVGFGTIAAVAALASVGLVASHDRAASALQDRYATRAALAAGAASTYAAQLMDAEQRSAAANLGGDTSSFDTVVNAFGFTNAVLLDGHGRLLRVFPPKPALVGVQIATRYGHLTAAVAGSRAISAVVPAAATSQPVVGFAVPFDTPTGRRVFSGAYAVRGTPLRAYLKAMVSLRTSRLYLVDDGGQILASSASDDAVRPLVAAEPALASPHGSGAAGRYGQEFVVSRPVLGTPWAVFAVITGSALLAPINGPGQYVPWAILGLLIVSSAVVWVLLLRRAADQITRRAREETFIRILKTEATHDPLTGLPNRALLTDRLAEAVTAATRDGTPLAVLFVDLDAFKDINDGSGHLLGDKVLVEVAARLRSAVRDGDTVARFGGDEFVVLLPQTDVAASAYIADRLLAGVLEPLEVDGRRLHVSASIGVAVSPPVAADALLRSADAAVYYAKSHGRAQVRMFVGELSERAEERARLSSDLQTGLHHDELNLIYQPVVDLASGHILGLEALARWQHPDRGEVLPDVFVKVAEETGLARRLDAWVLRRACTDMAELRRAGAVPANSYVAVNITAPSVSDQAFADVVQQVLSETELPTTALVVEVTETGVMADVDAGMRTLTALRALGVGVAIDDFGIGWSSLSYLKRLPANIVKLDRSFVARLHEDDEDLAIAASVIGLGQATGMTVVAEGVETPAQLAVLRQLRCSAGQGYLWHRGVPATEVAQAVRKTQQASQDVEPAPIRLPRRQSSKQRVGVEHGLGRLYELSEQGASMATIAAGLNRDGYRTVRGLRWHAKAVAAVLGGRALDAARALDPVPIPSPAP